ncbi:hypothetical protein OG711_38535 (plasmid) [Streptomyces uncialis]|uniref:hypothetical protein n=1 Tax=Streptomyces uncialis TaxID=1048205 RepID=UPI002E339300|nr:hypothetical protein [Streptomyces uncialis]
MTQPDSPDGPQPAWTAADYDSYGVLADLGVPHAAALVTRARRPHPPGCSDRRAPDVPDLN